MLAPSDRAAIGSMRDRFEQKRDHHLDAAIGSARISVSVVTSEFAQSHGGIRLIWTEQGAYLDGYNGTEAPEMRKGGTIDILICHEEGHLPAPSAPAAIGVIGWGPSPDRCRGCGAGSGGQVAAA
jgi:hypothetical protein